MLCSDLIPKPEEAPKLCRAKQLAVWLGCSERCIGYWEARGILPKRQVLGPRTKLFNVEQVRIHLQALEHALPMREEAK